jgi:hypothetical protein
MVGGYFSFQGIDGKARWRKTPVEEVLPVTCLPWDDRVEMPEGCVADPARPSIRCWRGSRGLALRARRQRGRGAEVLAARRFSRACPAGSGRASASGAGRATFGQGAAPPPGPRDIGPHWLSPAFCAWPGYGRLWKNLLGWLEGFSATESPRARAAAMTASVGDGCEVALEQAEVPGRASASARDALLREQLPRSRSS